MGWFSTKKKTYVGMSVSRLTEDEDLVNPSKLAITDALMNGGSIVDNILTYNANSYFRTVKRMRRHATKINYHYGLPQGGSYANATEGKVEEFIQDAYTNKPEYPNFVLNKLIVGMVNYDMYIKEYLRSFYHLDFSFEVNEGLYESCKLWLEDVGFTLNRNFDAYIDDEVFYKTGFPYNWGQTPYRPVTENNPATADLPTTGDSFADIRLVMRIPKVTTTLRFYLQPDDYIPEPEEPVDPPVEDPPPEDPPVDPPVGDPPVDPPVEPVTPPEEPQPDLTTSTVDDWLTHPFTADFESIVMIGTDPVETVTEDEVELERYANPDLLIGGTMIKRSQTVTEYFDYTVVDRVDLSGFYEEVLRNSDMLELENITDADYDPNIVGNPDYVITFDPAEYINVYGTYEIDNKLKHYVLCTTVDQFPGLHSYINAMETFGAGSYIPNLYLRIDGHKLNGAGEKPLQRYKDSSKIARKMGLNYSNFVDDIHEAMPSLGSVSSMILMWGVALKCTIGTNQNKLLARYAFQFYENLVQQGKIGDSSFAWKDNQMNGSYGYKRLIVSEEPTELEDGYFGAVSTEPFSYTEYISSMVYSGSGWTWITIPILRTENKNTYTINRVKDGILRKIIVDSPFHTQSVQGHTTTSTDYIEEEAVFIPYDLNIVIQMHLRLKDRNMMTAAAALILVTTYQVVKTKWYKRGIFKVVMLIIAIVIAVMFPPAGGWTIGAALTYAAVSIAVTIVINVVITLLIKMGFAPSLVAILAAVAAIVLAVMNPFGAAGSSQITAKTLLMAVNTGFNAFAQATAANVAELGKKVAAEMASIKVQLEKIEESRDMLGLNSVDYLKEVMFRNLTNFQANETPDQFLLRTTTVNVADISLKAVYEYTALRLAIMKGVGSPSTLQDDLARKLATLQIEI